MKSMTKEKEEGRRDDANEGGKTEGTRERGSEWQKQIGEEKH